MPRAGLVSLCALAFAACGDSSPGSDVATDGLAADGQADADATTEPPDGAADATTEPPDGAADASGPRVVASATIGPAGGVVAGDGVALRVPAGALAAATDLRIVEREAASAAYRLGPVLDLEPAGLRFGTPATLELALPAGVARAAIYWTFGDDAAAYQALPTTLTSRLASAPIAHFSSVYLGDPTVPGPVGWFCCAPKDPLTHTDADCIAWSAGAGTTCDPTICDLTPGACPTDPPGGGCCAPGPTGDEPTQGCASLVTYGQCALGVGLGFCTWSATCSTATPGCCAPAVPGVDATPTPCALLGGHGACVAAPECAWSASAACPVPPAPGAPPCASCVDPTFTNDPAFVASAQASWQLHGGATCATLAGAVVPPPSVSPGDPGFAAELGRWCAFDAAVAQNGCAAPATVSPSCAGLPASCCLDLTGGTPGGASCAALKTYDACAVTTGAGACQWNPVCPGAPGCCAPIDPVNDHPGLGCAAMSDFGECVNSLGYGFCQWQIGGGACAAPSLCEQCTDPSTLNDPDFQSAQQTWLALHPSPTCATLAASPLASPTAPPGTPAWEAELGPWCAFQQAANGLACAAPVPLCPNLPTSCCFATDPQDDLAQPGGCAALVTQFDCEYDVGLHYCGWNPGCGLATPKQCCVQIDPAVDEPVVGCDNMPDYGECVESLGFGYCEWDPSAGCPLPSSVSCPYCADPQFASDPDVHGAFVASLGAYLLGGCAAVLAAPVPGPSTPPVTASPGATTWETELGRFCGFEAAFAALGCMPSSTVYPACPAPPPPTTCCSALVPGLDPPTAACASLATYGDCTQGTGLGSCQWNPGPACVPPSSNACLDCVDPQWSADPTVVAAFDASFAAYVAGGCGAAAAAPVPAPTAPPVSASDKTQLGRFCGFEAALQAASCLPTATFTPSCPALPYPPPCCASVGPGKNPATGSCAGLASYAACLAPANAGVCQWTSSPACPAPVAQPCADCSDPAYATLPAFGVAFTASYQAYLSNGCGLVAGAPVPAPSTPAGSALYATQLGRYCGYQQAASAAGCGAAVPGTPCPVTLCQTQPALCPPPAPTCSACAALATGPGFAAAYNQSLSTVAAGCAAAQAAGPPAISAQPGTPAYGPQAGAYCGYLTGLQQHCNSPGCGGLGCAECIDPQHASNPLYYAALHFGWTRYGAETCADLAALAIPAPSQPSGTPAYESQLGRWCAFELALAANGCTAPATACPGLTTCTAQSVSCVLPTPTCADCAAPANQSVPAWQAGFAAATANLGPLGCAQVYASPPPTVTDGPASPYYHQQLGAWCGYQDQLYQKCGAAYSQCNVP